VEYLEMHFALGSKFFICHQPSVGSYGNIFTGIFYEVPPTLLRNLLCQSRR